VDILGALQWIYDHTPYPQIANVSVIDADQETGWVEVANEVLGVFLASPPRGPRRDLMTVEHSFGGLRDLARQLPSTDLLICSWFWAEFLQDRALAHRYWQAIRERLSPGCAVVFAERSGSDTKELLDELLEDSPSLDAVFDPRGTNAALNYSAEQKQRFGPFLSIGTQSYRFRMP
jgi:hypothetical protein